MELAHLVHLLTIIADLSIVAFIINSKKNSIINKTFTAITLLTVSWIFFAYIANYHASTHMEMFFWGDFMCYFSCVFLPALVLYFSIIFPENKEIPSGTVFGMFLPPILVTILLFSYVTLDSVVFLPGDVIQESLTPFHVSFLIYLATYMALSFYILVKKYYSFNDFSSKAQIRILLVGLIVPTTIGLIVNLLLPLLGIPYEWHVFHSVGPLSTVFFTIAVAYAMFKFRFMGFSSVLTKGIVYSLLATIVTASYFGLVFAASNVFKVKSGEYPIFVWFLLFFFFSLVFETMRDWLNEKVSILFLKSKVNYENTLREISSAMSLIADTDRILKMASRLIKRRMTLIGASVFVFNEKKERFEMKGADGLCENMEGFTMSSNYPIIEMLEETKTYILKYDIESHLSVGNLPEYEKTKLVSILNDFKKLNIALCIPSIFKERIIGFIALGEKESKDPFNEEDFDFLITIANQCAVFIENAQLMDREKDAVKKIAEGEVKEKYTAMLEKMNKELLDTREELVKAERLSTLTKLTVSLQHEINNPLTSVLAHTQGLLIKMQDDPNITLSFISERLRKIESESKRIREILRNLVHITSPIIREYMPGVEMIDITASSTRTEEQKD